MSNKADIEVKIAIFDSGATLLELGPDHRIVLGGYFLKHRLRRTKKKMIRRQQIIDEVNNE